MTATDELRRLLDERGVEWQDFDDEPTWMGSDGEMHYARQEFTFDGPTDNVTVYHLTPEQAIEATLGSDLKAENNKLRELCKDIYEFVYECQLGCEQYLATFDAERATYDESTCNDCWMERRMRELGVEV